MTQTAMTNTVPLTDELHQKIVDVVRAGNALRVAAEYAGVTLTTLRYWLDKGKADAHDSAHRQLHLAVKYAQAAAEARNVAIIQQAAQNAWQAAAWYLERTNPHRWAKHNTYDKTTAEKQVRFTLQIGDHELDDSS